MIPIECTENSDFMEYWTKLIYPIECTENNLGSVDRVTDGVRLFAFVVLLWNQI